MGKILDKVSYHAVYDDSILDALAFARLHGFAGVQVAVETPHLAIEDLSATARSEIRAYCADHSLSVSIHAPDDAVSLFTTSRYLRNGVFDYFGSLFGAASEIGAKLVTIHPGAMVGYRTHGPPNRKVPVVDRDLYRQAFAENLARVVELARDRLVLCVEYWRVEPMIEELLEPHLASGDLALCWDLAKTSAGGDRVTEHYFWDHLACVRQVHLHDVADGVSHRVIGTGQVDFTSLLPRLAEANVLDYCIEVRPRERALESFENLKHLVDGPAG